MNDPKVLFATRANTLRVAAEDIEAFSKRKNCMVHMRTWNSHSFPDTCHACQAGAVAIQSLNVELGTGIYRTPHEECNVLLILDSVREGKLHPMFEANYFNWKPISEDRCQKVAKMFHFYELVCLNKQKELVIYMRKTFVSWDNDPEAYIEWLHYCANIFDELEK